MRLLDRYLLRELVIPLTYCLAGFLLFWVAFDLLADLDEFQREKLRVLDILQYYLVRLPELLVVVLPVALLLALLYALANHSRHYEVTAMRSAGLSLWRICLPYWGVGAVLSLFLFLLNELWVPDSAERAERVRQSRLIEASGGGDQRWHKDLKFRNDAAARFWRIRGYNVETGEMREPYVEWTGPSPGERRQLHAERAEWLDGAWTFTGARLFVQEAGGAIQPSLLVTNLLTLPGFTETPEQIRSEIKVSQLSSVRAAKRVQLSLSEILNYKRLHPDLRKSDRALLDTQLHARLASPWTCLIVVAIAIPFGAASGRRNVFVGVAASIFICFGYFVLQRLGLAVGTGGYVPPTLAAWLPNLAFGLTGVVMILRAR